MRSQEATIDASLSFVPAKGRGGGLALRAHGESARLSEGCTNEERWLANAPWSVVRKRTPNQPQRYSVQMTFLGDCRTRVMSSAAESGCL